MAKLSHRVLVLSPFAPASARGNASTARRTASRLEACGATVLVVECDPALVARAIAEFKPEVLHGIHVGHTWTGLGGLPDLPLVLTLGGNDLFEDLGGQPAPGEVGATKDGSVALLQSAAAVLVATSSQQERSEQLRGSGDSVFFAPRCPEIGHEPIPGLDALIAGARGSAAPYTVTWSGALRHQKRPEWIAPIHRALIAELPGLVTIVAGPAPSSDAERALATELAQVPGIVVLPPFPGGGPGIGAAGTLLAVTDVALNTSRTEGKSNFVLEAIAESTPVVAANTPGNWDWLGSIAHLYDNEAEAVAALASLLRQPDLAAAQAARALGTLDLDAAKHAEADALARAHAAALGMLPSGG